MFNLSYASFHFRTSEIIFVYKSTHGVSFLFEVLVVNLIYIHIMQGSNIASKLHRYSKISLNHDQIFKVTSCFFLL